MGPAALSAALSAALLDALWPCKSDAEMVVAAGAAGGGTTGAVAGAGGWLVAIAVQAGPLKSYSNCNNRCGREWLTQNLTLHSRG